MGWFDSDPDPTRPLPAEETPADTPPPDSDRLPRRDPAGAAQRVASQFGGPVSDEATTVLRTGESEPTQVLSETPATASSSAPSGKLTAADILDDDLVTRAKRRMEILGRNPAAESTEAFPVPVFTDETPVVDTPASDDDATRAIRWDDDLTTRLLSTPEDDDTPGDKLALRDSTTPSPGESVALATAELAEKVHRARVRRRTIVLAVLTFLAVVGGVTTGYFAVNGFAGSTPPSQVRSDPDDGGAPATEHQPVDEPSTPDVTAPDDVSETAAPSASSSSASRSPAPKRSSPRPSHTTSKSPSPKPTPTTPSASPTPTTTPTEPEE